jgi:hypothetical protein
MTKQEVLRALADGKEVEVKVPGIEGRTAWVEPEYIPLWSSGDWEDGSWRLKEPSVKLVPLGPDDVDLHRDLFRFEEGEKRIAAAVSRSFLWFLGSRQAVSFATAQKDLERSVDGGKTWVKCEKEEVKLPW